MDYNELLNFTREIIFRNRMAQPANDQELDWFNNGITIELAATVAEKISEWRLISPGKTTADEIIDTVCEELEVSYADLCRRTRITKIVEARQIAMYLMTVHTPQTYAWIAKKLGSFDHATVHHSRTKAADPNLNKSNKPFAEKLIRVSNALKF